MLAVSDPTIDCFLEEICARQAATKPDHGSNASSGRTDEATECLDKIYEAIEKLAMKRKTQDTVR